MSLMMVSQTLCAEKLSRACVHFPRYRRAPGVDDRAAKRDNGFGTADEPRCGGFDECSSRPAGPASFHRAYHLAKQRREIPASAATCAIGRPASTRSHSRRRPAVRQRCVRVACHVDRLLVSDSSAFADWCLGS